VKLLESRMLDDVTVVNFERFIALYNNHSAFRVRSFNSHNRKKSETAHTFERVDDVPKRFELLLITECLDKVVRVFENFRGRQYLPQGLLHVWDLLQCCKKPRLEWRKKEYFANLGPLFRWKHYLNRGKPQRQGWFLATPWSNLPPWRSSTSSATKRRRTAWSQRAWSQRFPPWKSKIQTLKSPEADG
jgi:hypothetical protein